MKKLTINIDSNRLMTEIENTKDAKFNSGWRKPIFVHEFESEKDILDYIENHNEVSISLSFGSWISDGTWQPGAIEICALRAWDESEDDSDFIFDLIIEHIKQFCEKLESAYRDKFHCDCKITMTF